MTRIHGNCNDQSGTGNHDACRAEMRQCISKKVLPTKCDTAFRGNRTKGSSSSGGDGYTSSQWVYVIACQDIYFSALE